LAQLAPGGVESLVSKRSRRYRELGLAGKSLDDEAWLQLLSREPMMLRRPLVTDGRRLVIGYDADGLAQWAE